MRTVINHWVRRKIFNRARQYQIQWLHPDPEEVKRFQLGKLQTVWQDAVLNVPYYQKLIKEKKAPSTFDSLSEFFEKIPLLTREQITESPELFRRLDRKPDGIGMTAGSTGNPLHFGFYKRETQFPAVDLFVGRIANGMGIGDKIFLLWGHSHLLGTGWRGQIKHLLRKAKDFALGYQRVDAYHLDPEAARSYMKTLLNFKPQVLIGYTSALDLFVRHNQNFKMQARGLKLKFVVATSEVFPRSDTRELIEDFFDSSLVMEYGGAEFGAVAHNRSHQPYHVYWWDSLVEVLEEPGTAAPDSKPIVVTSLYPRYFPFIRYRTGDEVRGVSTLPEGSVIQFSEVCGRHNDVIKLNNGSLLHSVSLFHCIHQESQVYSIQLIVEPNGLRILLIASSENPEMVARIRRRLRDLNPSLENCKIEFVPDLFTNRAGKRRWMISRNPVHAQ